MNVHDDNESLPIVDQLILLSWKLSRRVSEQDYKNKVNVDREYRLFFIIRRRETTMNRENEITHTRGTNTYMYVCVVQKNTKSKKRKIQVIQKM